jgi:nitrate reductase gamma subunit
MTTFWTLDHLEGKEMLKFMGWAQGLYRLNPSAADLILDAYFIYKLHIVLGLTLFLITPFTRLVHIWSAPIWYLGRRGYQIVRTKQMTPRTRMAQGVANTQYVVQAKRPESAGSVPAE